MFSSFIFRFQIAMKNTVFAYLCLNTLQVPCCCKWQTFIIYDCVVFHCYISHLLYPFTWWALSLLPFELLKWWITWFMGLSWLICPPHLGQLSLLLLHPSLFSEGWPVWTLSTGSLVFYLCVNFGQWRSLAEIR